MLVAGTLGDHISTEIALKRPYIFEANPFALYLMTKGLWLPLDLVLLTVGIAIPYIVIRITRWSPFRMLLAYPFVHGFLRIGICIWNFSLIL
jgi:hypothetical protein